MYNRIILFISLCDLLKAGVFQYQVISRVVTTFDEKGQFRYNIARRLPHMGTSIKDLSVEELQTLISNTVRETMEDVIEDMIALSSESFLRSINQSRKDYNEGRIKSFEEVFNV